MTRVETMQGTVELVVETCYKCGVAFAIPQSMQSQCRRDTSQVFYCPNGHGQCYGVSREAQLESKLAALTSQLDQREASLTHARRVVEARDRTVSATRGHLTRLRNRVKHGVCPCCNRTFDNLAQHMHTQHPEFGGDNGQ